MQKFTIDWKSIPVIIIDYGGLKKPTDLCTIFKRYNIRKYTYEIILRGIDGLPDILIKIGMSADNSRNFAERIYRQLAHAKSWGELRIKGSSGADWLVIEEEFLGKYGFPIDKNLLTLKIRDLTNYKFTLINSWDEVNKIEAAQIEQYNKVYGQKPIGNINDEHNARFKPAINKATFYSIFDVEEAV
jgi:hypothetical protein